MSIQVDVTLRRVVWELSNWASKHKMVNDFFGYGEFLQLVNEERRSYPAMVVNVTSTTSDSWYINYSFEVMFLQYVNDEQDNRERAMSDTREYLNDLEDTVRYSNRWQNFSKVDAPFNALPAVQKGADASFGWVGTFVLKVKKRNGICNLYALMPEYDFETGSIVGPSCSPALIEVNGDTYGSVDSGGSVDIPVEYETAGTVPTTIEDGVVVVPDPEGDDATYQNSDNSFNVSIPSGDTYIAADIVNQVNGIDQDPIPANTSTNYIVEGDPATVELNGDDLEPIPSGEDKEMTITHENGAPVTITTVTDTANTFVGTIPNKVIHNSLPTNSGAYILGSFYSNDDADVNFGKGNPIAPFYLLEEENPFGNLYAYTGKTGGYQSYIDNLYYDKDGVLTTEVGAFPNEVILNWKCYKSNNSVLAISKELTLRDTLNDLLSDAPYTRDSHSDWEIWNPMVGMSFWNFGIYLNQFNYPPFNYDMATTSDYLWSSYAYVSNLALRFANGQLSGAGLLGVPYKSVVYRLYTPIELGITF